MKKAQKKGVTPGGRQYSTVRHGKLQTTVVHDPKEGAFMKTTGVLLSKGDRPAKTFSNKVKMGKVNDAGSPSVSVKKGPTTKVKK